jgi:hypothetical protein
MMISMVSSATATEARDVAVPDLLRQIKLGRWRKQIEQIRATFQSANGEKEKVSAMKKCLPGATFSGRFSRRANDALIEYSGFICADLDSLGNKLPEVRSKLRAMSNHAYAMFASPSGDGLKVIFRVVADPERHYDSFRAIREHLREIADVECDESAKDLARLCFVSFDPGLDLNEEATEIKPLPPEPRPRSISVLADLGLRQRIAVELFGKIDWKSETHGFVACPGRHLHTTGDGERDCEIHLDGAPTLFCFHASCRGIIVGVNHELRSRIGKAESTQIAISDPPSINQNASGANLARLNSEKPEENTERSDCCFDTGRNQYWISNQRGAWIALNETQFKRELKQRGVSPIVPKSSFVSPLDERLLDIQHNCDVHYSGALAGYNAGIYQMGERRILVIESPRIIQPSSGAWRTLQTFILGLLNDPQFDQVSYLYGWLKVAYEALRSRQRRPGQGLVLAGVCDCGKSLLQNVITLILGGRSARPYQFMSGLTPFNSDLFEAEHLMIEDEQASTDIRARRNLGAQLKNLTVIDWQRCHAKHRVAISLTPFWRLSISVNDEPENLMVLPPIDDSIEDKLIILRASKSPMPMPTMTLEQRKAFWETFESELPAFLAHLIQWQIPAELSSDRFGIAHFHHPEILRTIDNLAPEFRLKNLIDDQLFKDGDDTWQGRSEQLERLFTAEDSACRFEARRLFTFNTACGVYLSRLAKKEPERFSYDRTSSARLWTIKAPIPHDL